MFTSEKDAIAAANLDLAREPLEAEFGAAREVCLAARLDLLALEDGEPVVDEVVARAVVALVGPGLTTTPRASPNTRVCPPSDRPTSPLQRARETVDDALDNLYVATGVKRAHVAATICAAPLFVASWQSAALLCVGMLYPVVLAARSCAAADTDRAAAADRKNLFSSTLY